MELPTPPLLVSPAEALGLLQSWSGRPKTSDLAPFGNPPSTGSPSSREMYFPIQGHGPLVPAVAGRSMTMWPHYSAMGVTCGYTASASFWHSRPTGVFPQRQAIGTAESARSHPCTMICSWPRASNLRAHLFSGLQRRWLLWSLCVIALKSRCGS